MRIGHGYDVHALAAGSGLVLGGIVIPCDFCFVAHSDGDVLIHALCDALLGAMGKGDIGGHFSDQDSANRNRNSREFLRIVQTMMAEENYQLGNADITIIAQSPKMAPHLKDMKDNLAFDLVCDANRINIKATTTEKLGFAGRKEGIAVHAVVLLEKVK